MPFYTNSFTAYIPNWVNQKVCQGNDVINLPPFEYPSPKKYRYSKEAAGEDALQIWLAVSSPVTGFNTLFNKMDILKVHQHI